MPVNPLKYKDLVEAGFYAYFQRAPCPYDGVNETWEWEAWNEGYEQGAAWEAEWAANCDNYVEDNPHDR